MKKMFTLKSDMDKYSSLENTILEFDVDFSYCWLNLEASWYSLEQYIGCIIR